MFLTHLSSFCRTCSSVISTRGIWSFSSCLMKPASLGSRNITELPDAPGSTTKHVLQPRKKLFLHKHVLGTTVKTRVGEKSGKNQFCRSTLRFYSRVRTKFIFMTIFHGTPARNHNAASAELTYPGRSSHSVDIVCCGYGRCELDSTTHLSGQFFPLCGYSLLWIWAL